MKWRPRNCYPKEGIMLNPALLIASRARIDYVITRKLCHIHKRHHGGVLQNDGIGIT